MNVFRRKMQGQVGRSSAWAAASTPDILSCPSLPSIGYLAKGEKGQRKTERLPGTFAPNQQLHLLVRLFGYCVQATPKWSRKMSLTILNN